MKKTLVKQRKERHFIKCTKYAAHLLIALWLIVSCGNNANDETNDNTTDTEEEECNTSEYLEWDSKTYTESIPIADTKTAKMGCDPYIAALAYYDYDNEYMNLVGSQLEVIVVSVDWGTSANGTTVNMLVFMAGTPGQQLTTNTPYNVKPDSLNYESGLYIMDTDSSGNLRFCEANQGTVTITSLGAVDQPINGEYNITEWVASSGTTCPTLPHSGNFSVIRNN